MLQNPVDALESIKDEMISFLRKHGHRLHDDTDNIQQEIKLRSPPRPPPQRGCSGHDGQRTSYIVNTPAVSCYVLSTHAGWAEQNRSPGHARCLM